VARGSQLLRESIGAGSAYGGYVLALCHVQDIAHLVESEGVSHEAAAECAVYVKLLQKAAAQVCAQAPCPSFASLALHGSGVHARRVDALQLPVRRHRYSRGARGAVLPPFARVTPFAGQAAGARTAAARRRPGLRLRTRAAEAVVAPWQAVRASRDGQVRGVRLQ
jgi:hypothetical protein